MRRTGQRLAAAVSGTLHGAAASLLPSPVHVQSSSVAGEGTSTFHPVLDPFVCIADVAAAACLDEAAALLAAALPRGASAIMAFACDVPRAGEVRHLEAMCADAGAARTCS